VASEIENGGWRRYLGFMDLPEVTPEEAGRNLGRLAGEHDVTLYAHYATDIAGHRAGMKGSIRSLERVDGFLGGVLQSFPREGGLVVTSDHGNIEEATGGHTRNPALGLFVGSAAHVAQRTRPASIMDVPGILGLPAETPDPPDYPAAPEGEPS
jgi:bisphosphoglycerate-independent phosphoglycerate mutase (AlkP superfamily)